MEETVAMKHLSAVIPSYSGSASSASSRSELPFDGDDLCPRCSEDLDFEDGSPVQHACCGCLDAGRVRLPLRVGEPGFGKTVPCPDCHGVRPGVVEDVAGRMRIPMLHRSSRVELWTPAGGKPRVVCEQYVASWPPEKPFLLLTGERGTGKTHLACGVLRAVFEYHGKRGRFWPVIDLLDRYKATFDAERATETVEQIDQEMRQIEVLVLDDFGTHKSTEWAEERLFRLVDERYRDLRPLVMTSNVQIGSLPGRVKSRFADVTVASIVYFDGPDRRPEVRR